MKKENKKSDPQHFTRGGQIVFHNLRMFFQVHKALFKLSALLSIPMAIFFLSVLTTSIERNNYLAYQKAKVTQKIKSDKKYKVTIYDRSMNLSKESIVNSSYLENQKDHVNNILLLSIFISLFCALTIFFMLTLFFIKKGKNQTDDYFVRGNKLEKTDVVRKMIISNNDHSDIVIDKFPLIKNAEVQHFLIHGSVGMGKSQLIMKLIDQLRHRGDRVIVYDKGCSFIPCYYQENTDIILNAFDARCANWDLWAEAPHDSHLENMAESLIPMHGETDPFWVNAARTVFSSAAAKMRHDPERSLEKLLHLLLTEEFMQLESFFSGTPAATLVSGKIEKTAISIRSVITTYLKSLQALIGLSAGNRSVFSIRDYLLDNQKKGWLFISSNGEQHKSLKPLISMWLSMAALTLLSLSEDKKRRIWFICDELPSLHKLPLLGETIAEVRKFGGCFVLGMQSFSQLVKVYGRSGASEIFDLLNTRAFFSSPSSEMAQLVSKELGSEEIEDTRENYSYGANSIRDGISLGKQNLTRPLVTFTEIMNLDPLSCYLKLPRSYPVTQLKLTYEERTRHSLGFISRDIPLLAEYHTTTDTSSDQSKECSGDEQAASTLSVKTPETPTIDFFD